MEKFVAKVNDQICRKLEQRLPSEIKVCQICESAGFVKKISIGQYFKTIHDVDDGFGGTTGA